MQRWRYHSLIIRDLSICEAKLNAEGDKGWELVSLTSLDGNAARAFFKMPVDEGFAEQPAANTQQDYSQPYPEYQPPALAVSDVAVAGSNPFDGS
jgi:hypothetical protein